MKKAIAISLFLVLNLFLFAQNGKKDKFDRNLYTGKYTNKDFFEKADYIFEGEYVESESYLVDDSTKVYTQYLLKVNEVYKGNKKLEKGTVILIKNSGTYTGKPKRIDDYTVAFYNNDYNIDYDFYVHSKHIFFCSESDLEESLNQFNASNNFSLKFFQNAEHAGLNYYEEESDLYNFLIEGLNHLYFKDKKKFYKFAKQFEGIKIPKQKKS